MSNTIFLIVGESGSGKTILVSSLEKQKKLKSIQSYTTRKPRYEDEYGHIFISENEFNLLEGIVGYTEYNGNKYCATSQQVEENDLYVIDIDGVDFFRNAYKGNKNVRVIYIKSDIGTRFDRMVERGEKDGLTHSQASDIAIDRIKNDVMAFRNAKDIADFIVYNNSDVVFQDVVIKVWNYIRGERGSEEWIMINFSSA